MKKIINLAVIGSILILVPFVASAGLEYPDSQDPEVFTTQVERMIARSVEEGLPIIGNESETRSQLIKEDTRNWESALEKIANHPEQFGARASREALNLANHRGTFRKSPALIQGAITVLQFEKESALKKGDEYKSRGEPVHYSATTNLGSFIAFSLRELKSPELLQEILVYFNSKDEETIGKIKDYAPNHVANALHDYGDARHIDEALKFAAKLREAGRTDIADNVGRSVERLRKDVARAQTSSTDGIIDQSKGGAGTNDPADRSNRRTLWPWLAAGAALIAALLAYFRLRRTGT